MLTSLLSLLLCLPLLLNGLGAVSGDLLQSGQCLRLHVLARDDTPAMQAIKLPVRDAIRETYRTQADPDQTMLENAEALLPSLTQAARTAARQVGFDGDVTVLLGRATFEPRVLNGIPVPAGDYPALIVRLGEGRGHNWWGLVDPDRSLLAACLCAGTNGLEWDWSAAGFWQALLRGFSRGGSL